MDPFLNQFAGLFNFILKKGPNTDFRLISYSNKQFDLDTQRLFVFMCIIQLNTTNYNN